MPSPALPDGTDESLARLATLTGEEPDGWLKPLLNGLTNPLTALTHLERWLASAGNPATKAQILAANPIGARVMLLVLGASRHLADVVVQNSELGDLLVGPHPFDRVPDREEVYAECLRLSKSASSHSHSLDLIRFVRQRWILLIAAADLAKAWDEPKVWRALSELACGLLLAVREVVWAEYAKQRLEGSFVPCPVQILALGKLGGCELNYSSDVDLVYLLDDDADESLEGHAIRFCEALGRALSERMGRGALYRVDLRLRPYGGTGPIVTRIRAYESYLRNYAEPWEQLALIRSQPIGGEPDLRERLEALRIEVGFQGSRGEWVIDDLVAIRERIEEAASPDDLKRGPGGIRDIEFLVQIFQMLYGARFEEAKAPSLLDALSALHAGGVIDDEDFATLREAYLLLRQTEHRCQLLDDRQTHRLPSDPSDLSFIEANLGILHLAEHLASVRTGVRRIYSRLLRTQGETGGPAAFSEAVESWLDKQPNPSMLRHSAVVNLGSRDRLETLATLAPSLVGALRLDPILTEQIVSGEIEEQIDPVERFAAVADNAGLARVARALHLAWAVQSIFAGQASFRLEDVYDTLLERLVADDLAVIALGSFAGMCLGFESDADVLLLCPVAGEQETAERAAQRLLTQVKELAQQGSPLKLDLRLRPEGGKGLLAPTLASFASYSASGMEMWERFALGRARIVRGDPSALDAVLAAAYDRPLDMERLDELLEMKSRIETERVPLYLRTRNFKHGEGSLDDIEWLTQLHFLAVPSRVDTRLVSTQERLSALRSCQLLSEGERERLLDADAFFRRLRFALSMVGSDRDVMPENPEKLALLARYVGSDGPNALLETYEDIRSPVRSSYLDGVENLRLRLPRPPC